MNKILLSFLKSAVLVLQLVLLYLSNAIIQIFFSLFKNKKKNLKKKFTIGAYEIAKNIYYLSGLFPDSYSVCLTGSPYYKELKYSFLTNSAIVRILFGPCLLAYFSHLSDVFIYIWRTGFMMSREYDFIFLKKRNKKIVTIFVGSDIRSPKLTTEFFNNLNMDSRTNYYSGLTTYIGMYGEKYENEKKKIAEIADKYSDLIFNSKIDQRSYLKREPQTFTYMIDLKEYPYNPKKFDDLQRVKIVHGPTAPITKGTQLVRAALKKLEVEGYQFEYIELIGVPNTKVKEILAESHIVLNEFYATAPGLFTIEGLATFNAVLTSGDPKINPYNNRPGCEKAWVITHYWEIYDKLKMLLDNPSLIQQYAEEGRKFVENNYTIEKAREYLVGIFKSEGII